MSLHRDQLHDNLRQPRHPFEWVRSIIGSLVTFGWPRVTIEAVHLTEPALHQATEIARILSEIDGLMIDLGRRHYVAHARSVRVVLPVGSERLQPAEHLPTARPHGRPTPAALDTLSMASDDHGLSTVEQIYDRHVAEEKLKHGTKYERLTAMVFKTLDADATVTHDVRLRGDGKKTVHQIDVRVTKDGKTKRTIIECRDKEPGNKIDLDEARSFATVVRELDSDGVMVTTRGFTGPAITLAEDVGLTLLVLRPFIKEDKEGRLMQINLTVTAVLPVPDSVRVEPPAGTSEEAPSAYSGSTEVTGAGSARTLEDLVKQMMPAPLHEPPEGPQQTVRKFDPPAVIHAPEGPIAVASVTVDYHVETTSVTTTIDAGEKIAELLIRSLDGTFDRVIWDADLRQLGFDPQTGDVIGSDDTA